MDWLYWTLTTAYFITVISIVGLVLSENRSPVKSLAWVTVLLLLPVGGILLYVFFGRSLRHTRMISRSRRRRLRQLTATSLQSNRHSAISDEHRQLSELVRSVKGAPATSGNQVKVYHHGKDKFEDLIHDISHAQHYINLQYYIIADDDIGRKLADELIMAAKRGVTVRVIYDHIGSLSTSRRYFEQLRDAGIDVHPFFRVAVPWLAHKLNWRNHRKIVVIDGHTGYIGGMNVADRYIYGNLQFANWRDTHLRIQGPAVAMLQYSFAVDWSYMGQPLPIDNAIFSTNDPPQPLNDITLQLITSGPASPWSSIAFTMLKAIGLARRRICIQTPYFLPPESILKSLQAAALAKVDVRIMIPRMSDSRMLTYASFSYITECLRSGIKIYLYDGGMLHSKVMIIDHDLATVGSANMDFRSFEHNFEGTMIIYSPETNAELYTQFLTDMSQSQRITEAIWRRRQKSEKALSSVVRLLSPVL